MFSADVEGTYGIPKGLGVMFFFRDILQHAQRQVIQLALVGKCTVPGGNATLFQGLDRSQQVPACLE